MKYNYYIATKHSTSVISGTQMFIDGDTLYVYDGEELAGLFKLGEIRVAHRSVEKA